ncbi:PucR family transcriptional regulator [Streptomyces fuscigenes]|uniref:PucR family transcriptional regulator n=1 Tax=Streptomyces fuscigenes TaxID=1528880 RepID=UPI001F2BD390|nr:helix-turn-helix domain-containing protein [Streptomyces fuscigenes]MCF3963297.1 helix-turn-helix domain-containing protein [Streptomyces fuscigenes]
MKSTERQTEGADTAEVEAEAVTGDSATAAREARPAGAGDSRDRATRATGQRHAPAGKARPQDPGPRGQPYAGEPVAELCGSLEREAPVVVPRIVASIRRRHPDYVVVPPAEHEEAVRLQLHLMLSGLTERRPPTAAEADLCRDLGRRRARQGLPLESLVAAYHAGYRDVWDLLLERSREAGPGLAEQLLSLVGIAWSWLETSTAVITDAHTEATRSREQRHVALGHQLLEALYAGRAADPETHLLAQALAFDPEGAFTAVACRTGAPGAAGTEETRRWARDHGFGCAAASRGPSTVFLFQHADEAALRRRLRDLGAVPAGLGLSRRGLPGAAESVRDAESALRVAATRADGTEGADGAGVVAFEEDWLLATLLPHAPRLAALLEPVERVGPPAQSAHLRDAVRAYAAHGFSISAAADSLRVHPNTVKYRLERWQSRTGWDARSLDGLLKSLLALATYG